VHLLQKEPWCRVLGKKRFRKKIQAECEYSRGCDLEDTLYVIGSVWTNPNGNRHVPYLNNWNDKRKLNLNYRNDQWDRNYRFAAVRNDLRVNVNSRLFMRREFQMCLVAFSIRRAFCQLL
jgi:hypothetical protein